MPELNMTKDQRDALRDAGNWDTDEDFAHGIKLLDCIDTLLARPTESVNTELLEALRKIACFDDAPANTRLALTGSYSAFDEPGSVELARAAISRAEAERAK